MFWRYLTIFFCFLVLIDGRLANSLVGSKDKVKQTQNLPVNSSRTSNVKSVNSSKKNVNNKTVKRDNGVVTNVKTKDIPDFPQENNESFKMLFDDGFSNVVEDRFQQGEEWDIFVTQSVGKDINRNYIAGHDEDYTQMDAIEAEKKTLTDSLINKDNISTYRTRVMAYLTIDQMIFDNVLNAMPYGYYVNTITN